MVVPNSSIQLGSHSISRIGYDQLKPGDFVCTYEALTTQPELLHISSLFEFANQSRSSEFNKMFHTEVIIHTYNRLGVYRIAHGDGVIQKIVSQDDNFRDHHPGQAFLVFRAKNKAIRREIINIASKTSEPGNDHVCKTLYLNSLLHRKEYALNYFKFENSNFIPLTARKIAESAVNYDECGTFYHTDGKGEREMSCVEYVANVINVAVLRKLCSISKLDQRLDKINSLFEQVIELNRSGDFLFKFSHAHATPSGLVEFLLNNRSQFKTVGYLGFISDPIEGPRLDVRGESIQISPKIIMDICISHDSSNFQPDPHYIASVMHVLEIMDSRWRIYSKPVTDPIKLHTLFVWLTTYFPHFSLKAEMLTQFLSHARQVEKICVNDLPPLLSLPFQEVKEILLLEKEILKVTSMPSTEKTLKFSLNVLACERMKINKLEANLKQVFQGILTHSNSNKYEESLHRINERKAICQKKLDNLLMVHEKIRDNGYIALVSDIIPKGFRPWIHFSLNEQIWDVKPFILEGKLWKANIHIPRLNNIIYRLFIGPENIEDPDPVLKAQAWQQTTLDRGIFISSSAIQALPSSDLLLVDICNYPQWNPASTPFRRSPQIFAYQQKCDAIAPFPHIPSTIDEYEKKYSDLESNLEPIKAPGLFYEEKIIGSLKTFLEIELRMNIHPKQIQFMKGGLGQGLSGDRIYVILDNNHRPFLVVKSFMRSKGKFSREFFTLMNHEKLGLKYLKLPEVAAISAAEVDNKQIYFLALRYIAGTSVYGMFMALFAHKLGSPGRQEALNNLLWVYAKLGKGIGELHSAAKGPTLPMHPAFIDLLKKFSKHAFIKFEEHCDPLFLKQLRTYFESKFTVECERPFVRGYFHGDINAGNLIYNSVIDELSLIDWPDGSSSVGQKGEPQGIYFYDLIQIKNELATRKTQGLTEDEFFRLYEAFNLSYIENGPPIPPVETMEFFSSIDLIGSVKWFLDKKNVFAPDQLSTAQSIYEFKLEALKALVNAFYMRSSL